MLRLIAINRVNQGCDMRRLSVFLIVGLALLACGPLAEARADRPNILWLSVEDTGPQLGCYGDPLADTPNIDRFAESALRYTAAWSNAPVCAPARTAIITGMSPTSLGAQHMRSLVDLPEGVKLFPQYLREAGYYCTNNRKEDYNVRKPGRVWDESSGRAHYANRAEGQPFFAVFNNTTPHEGQVRGRRDEVDRVPDELTVPAHHPDLPAVRRDWASYYQLINQMDGWFGQRLRELEEAGLHEETIVFFWGDHGAGMPRHKRWPYQSGLNVPLIVYVPPKYEHLAPEDYTPGGRSDRLVAFEDFAPTVLSLAGIQPPAHMQGRAFMGEHEAEPRQYLFGFRDRMDERIDMVRTVRGRRYQYIRNYMPHRIYGLHLRYMYEGPTPAAWQQAYEQGRLRPPLTFYWEPKPPVELYDLENDPDQVHNLAYTAEHAAARERLAAALREHILQRRDTGFLPEGQLNARSGDDPPYTMAQAPQRYPVEAVYEAAELASGHDLEEAPALAERLVADDAAVRYWAATGLLIRGQHAVWPHRQQLREMMRQDDDPSVRVVAAEALARFGDEADLAAAREALLNLADLREHDTYTATAALNAIDLMREDMEPIFDDLFALPATHPDEPPRSGGYPQRLLQTLREGVE